MTQSSTAAAEMQTASATEPPQTSPPVVDPSPYAAPIALNNQSLEELLGAHPAPASSAEVLAFEPNRYEDATVGPDAQIDPNTYVEMTRPDGGTFLSPLSNVAYYRRKGFTEGAEQEIPDLVAYWAEQAGGPHMEEKVQSPEDAIARITGVPKTPEELEAERAELEQEREGLMAQRAGEMTQPTDSPLEPTSPQPQPLPGPEPGPTPPEPEPMPEPQPEPAPEPNPTP